MIPAVYFNLGSDYTLVTSSKIVRCTVKSVSFGMLHLANAEIYDFEFNQKEVFDTYELECSEVQFVGYCTERRNIVRNVLCWELNHLSYIDK